MRIRRKVLDDLVTMAVLFLATGAFLPLVVDPTDTRAATDGSLIMEALWIVVYVVVVIRLIPHYRRVLALVCANKALMLLVLLAICSIVWSEFPGLTLRRGVALLATTLIGIDFAVRYSVRDQVRMVCIVLCVVVLLGIATRIISPNLIPSGDYKSDAWHGLLGYKNEWAGLVVLAAVAVLSRSRRSYRGFIFIAALSILAFVLVAATQSVGALVLLAVVLLLSSIFPALKWRWNILTIAAIVSALTVLPMCYFLFQNFDKVTDTVGRDPSLTGRTDLWQLAFSSIGKSPVYGYGYSAFWDADSPRANRIREEVNWDAPHAHNGFIDLTLELGLAGLLLLIAGYFIAARRAVNYFLRGVGREAMWPLVYLSFFFLHQLTEGGIVTGNSIYWILYVAVCFSVTKVSAFKPHGLKNHRASDSPINTHQFDPKHA